MKTQQHQLYASEDTIDLGPELTLAEIQQLVDRLRDTWWWERTCSNVLRVRVQHHGRMKMLGVGGYEESEHTGYLTFSGRTVREQYVVHELAHVLARARFRSTAHDPWFARIYVELTFLVRGAEAYSALAEAFRRDGIDFDADGVVDSDAVRV